MCAASFGRRAYEQGGIIKDVANLVNAATSSEVPHLTVMTGASYAGNYGT